MKHNNKTTKQNNKTNKQSGRESTNTITPPPYDGGRTEDFALTDAPVYVEHGTGENENSGAVLGLQLAMPLAADTMAVPGTGDDYNQPELRADALDIVEGTLKQRYETGIPDGYRVDVQLDDDGATWDGTNKRWMVYYSVEMYGGLYREGETFDQWASRVMENCHYNMIYKECGVFYTAHDVVVDALASLPKLPA